MYLRVNLLGPDPRLMKKRIYRAAVSQRLRNTAIEKDVRISNAAFSSERFISCFGDVSLQITFTEVSYKNRVLYKRLYRRKTSENLMLTV